MRRSAFEMTSFLAFLGISIIVIATPGPDTAMVIRNTLLGGRIGGALTALGISVGNMVWALATSVGVVALLIAFEPVFLFIKYAGAAYLIYLGAQALRDALRPQDSVEGERPYGAPSTRLTSSMSFRQRLFSNLGNPKIAIFFASLLPQFAPQGDGAFAALLLLGFTFSAMGFAWLTIYVLAVSRTGDFLRRSGVRRMLEGITGTVLIALGLRIATEQR
jgi:threonine/homoserine/homoserine lactone efflux protein